MQIQVNTDPNVDGHEKLADHVRGVVEKALAKVGGRVTRVEVHITQENKGNGPEANKCVMEARVERHQPTTATHRAPSVKLAVDGAADKLERALHHLFDKLRERR
jgi:ribosome-associated translation inhibitor RaiA